MYQADIEIMSHFVDSTIALHRSYLDRLADLKDEGSTSLEPIRGVLTHPLVSLTEACEALKLYIPEIKLFVKHSLDFAKKSAEKSVESSVGLEIDEIAALFLYTLECGVYRKLNQVI